MSVKKIDLSAVGKPVVGLECPLGCGGHIVVSRPVTYDNVSGSDEAGNDFVGVRFELECNKCGASSWEPMRGDISQAKARELGVKYGL
jgi:hypothetical protein